MKNPNTNIPRGKVSQKQAPAKPSFVRLEYPFAAIVGQEEMKLALVLNLINPGIGGVLIMGQRGTGKSTTVRALAELLPPTFVVQGCPYRCDPLGETGLCDECGRKRASGTTLQGELARVTVVDLPLGATEDRVCGTIDIESALREGHKRFEPGLLARANRGFLYIDEVNLLEDHLVDLLLDVAVTGRNKVERESISAEHPARFVLIGSGNPEEGELRPQLLDRFGLLVEVQTENDLATRVEIVERREAFDRDPASFIAQQEKDQKKLQKKIASAQKNVASVNLTRPVLLKVAQLCSELRIDGHRGELTISRASRALAALEGRRSVTTDDVRCVAGMALRHRLRADPLEETAGSEQIQQALDRVFGSNTIKGSLGDKGAGGTNGNTATRGLEETGKAPTRGLSRSASPSGTGTVEASRVISAPIIATALVTPLVRDRVDRPPARPRQTNQTPGRRAGHWEGDSQRGRYVRAVNSRTQGERIAVDATLRAAAGGGRTEGEKARPLIVPFHSLRFKQLKQKSGRLFIFAIDTSGSMALNRISQAKGAVLSLLRESYIKRDSVALIAFRGTSAELVLPPSRSILRARRALDSLGIGGATPLSAALVRSLQVARRSEGSYGEIVLALFTDGAGNVPLSAQGNDDRAQRGLVIEREVTRLGAELKKAHVTSVVVNTQKAFNSDSETRTLARRLGARFMSLQTAEENLAG